MFSKCSPGLFFAPSIRFSRTVMLRSSCGICHVFVGPIYDEYDQEDAHHHQADVWDGVLEFRRGKVFQLNGPPFQTIDDERPNDGAFEVSGPTDNDHDPN